MTQVETLITEHLDLWTSAVKPKKAAGRGRGKGSSSKRELYGLKKLRELILELAVRGQLVPQDPNDEPASVLLERIAAEKARLIAEKKIKKQKVLPPITDDEKPFDLPQGWEFVRLVDIINIASGDGLTSSNMNKEGGIPVFGGNGITGHHDAANVSKTTLVIGRVGFYCGSIHITPDKAWVTDNAFLTHFSEENIWLDFLYWLLKGTNLKENDNATAQPVISGKKIYPIVVGLPPLAEQKRIVAKVDELMQLCDQLEQTTETNLDAHQTLVENLLAALTNAPEEIPSVSPFAKGSALQTAQAVTGEPPPLEKGEQGGFNAWQRIATHFDTLFTTEHSIDQLKKSIVQSVANGKFSFDVGDDKVFSYEELIAVAQAEQAEMILDGQAKKEKVKPLVIDHPYSSLPENWFVFQLYEVTVCFDHRRVPIKKAERQEGIVPYYGANGAVGFIDKALFDEELVLVVEDETFIGRTKPFSYMVSGPSWVNNHAHVLKCTSVVMPEFLNIALSYYPLVSLTSGTTGRKKLTKNTLLQLPIALPPLAEQQRIVAKVDELMTLCDQLKNRLNTAQQTQWQLADAVARVNTTP